MTYATMLLHLEEGPRMRARAEFALRLAQRFESHLVAVAAADRALHEMSLGAGYAGREPLMAVFEASRRAADACADMFRGVARNRIPRDCEVVVDDQDEVGALLDRSCCADLLIVGQPDPLDASAARRRTLLERLVLHSVAPVLVLPATGEWPDVGQRIVVAWNGSPESARAAVGALPLLQRAGKVTLLQCDSQRDTHSEDVAAALELPLQWLARHRVHAEALLEQTGGDVGDALLSRATDLDADLLVMGAWGHPRWTERVLGGTTRRLLASTTLPLLMSH
jgi:nucleotide-binding universal stress UspA family protein